MKNRTKTILTVSFDMDDLYQVFADENIPSTDENVEQVLSEETKKKLRDSAFQKGLDVLREQVKELENKGEEKEAGFLEFCQDEWEYTWQGEGTWHSGGVHVDIDGNGTVDFKVSDLEKLRAFLGDTLKKNPYLSADDLFALLSEELDDVLDSEYEDYAEVDDYYPPVGEDFEFRYYVEEFCKKCGLELTSCDFDGSTSDYEPD